MRFKHCCQFITTGVFVDTHVCNLFLSLKFCFLQKRSKQTIHLKWKWWDQFQPWQCIGYVFSKYVSTYLYQSEYLFMGMFLLQRSSNAAQSLCDLIRLSRDHMSQLQENADQDPLLDAVQRWLLLYCVVQQSVNRYVEVLLSSRVYLKEQTRQPKLMLPHPPPELACWMFFTGRLRTVTTLLASYSPSKGK